MKTLTATKISVHVPPSCTCARIVWLAEHCDRFELDVGTDKRDAMINASFKGVQRWALFRPSMLRESVAGVFHAMWKLWEPEEGIKS